MEKKLFQAFAISFVFLLIWSYILPKKNEVIQAPQESKSSGAVKKTDSSTTALEQEAVIEEEPIELKEARIGNFLITYSPTGGYIKELVANSDKKPLSFKNIGVIPSQISTQFSAQITEDRIIFNAPGAGKKEFVFEDNLLRIILGSEKGKTMEVFSNYLDEDMLDQRYQELFYNQGRAIERKYFSNRMLGLAGKGIQEGSLTNVEFAGARGRYYCISLLKGSYDIKWEKAQYIPKDENARGPKTKIILKLPQPDKETLVYLGPQAEKYLQPFELQEVIYFGFFHLIGVFMTKVLYFFFSFTKNWGLSIIFFSSLTYLCLYPFTAKSMKAMRKIQQLQPELEALKVKHKDSPEKLQKESIEFYRKHKINPASGCLPLFFQLPVFMALYQVIFRLFALKGANFLWISDLSQPDHLYQLPFTIPILNTNYFNLLPILVMILGFIQQKVSSPASATGSQQQKSMGLFMTVFIGFIFYNFPSALVLYWFTQNIFTITFQAKLAKAKNTTPAKA
mgnify:CR=1 FL=1|tara:strand:- start:708 stop:2234 length:1527 start_codon:yes stop_codon:yes gene_type:complete